MNGAKKEQFSDGGGSNSSFMTLIGGIDFLTSELDHVSQHFLEREPADIERSHRDFSLLHHLQRINTNEQVVCEKRLSHRGRVAV